MAFEKYQNRNKVFDNLPELSTTVNATTHDVNTAGHAVIPPFTAVRVTAPSMRPPTPPVPAMAGTRTYRDAANDRNTLTFTADIPGVNDIMLNLNQNTSLPNNTSTIGVSGDIITVNYDNDSIDNIVNLINNNPAASALVTASGTSSTDISVAAFRNEGSLAGLSGITPVTGSAATRGNVIFRDTTNSNNFITVTARAVGENVFTVRFIEDTSGLPSGSARANTTGSDNNGILVAYNNATIDTIIDIFQNSGTPNTRATITGSGSTNTPIAEFTPGDTRSLSGTNAVAPVTGTFGMVSYGDNANIGNTIIFRANAIGSNNISLILRADPNIGDGMTDVSVNSSNLITIRYNNASIDNIVSNVNAEPTASNLITASGESRVRIFAEDGVAQSLSGTAPEPGEPAISPVINLMPTPTDTAPAEFGFSLTSNEYVDFRTEKDEMYIHWEAFVDAGWAAEPDNINYRLRVFYW